VNIPAAMKALDPGSPFRVTNDAVKYWFRILNHEIWQGQLPMFNTIQIRPFVKNWAMCIEDTDTPQTKYRLAIDIEFPSFELFVNVLAHEMIHLHQFINHEDDEHDDSFWKWESKFASHGLKLEQVYGH
jgi:predicted metal-dependent hydrolase